MSRRNLLTPLLSVVLVAIISVVAPAVTGTSPTLGLDLQGGISVVLQAKPVDGELPSESAVERSKEIIRERVDGMGVAEPDITRQGRTVVVQLPGMRDQDEVEKRIGCTGLLEFRPVLAMLPAPAADVDTAVDPEAPTTTTGEDPATTTTAAADGDDAGGDEQGSGTVGVVPGEGALPAQFRPTTTTAPTTTEATTTTEVPPTTEVPETTTTIPEGEPSEAETGTRVLEAGSGGACGSTDPISLADAKAVFGDADGTAVLGRDDGLVYLLGPVGFGGESLSKAEAVLEGGWTVLAEVRSEDRARANETFNECATASPSCPGLGGTGGPGSVAIVLDGEVLSAPAVQQANLANDEFSITGNFGESEAKDLALKLRYGSLPVVFEQAALQQVSATLGSDSLQAGLIAGGIGIAALGLYMILYYRGFGMTVVASLLVWMALMWGLICFLSETQGLALTLAGITGIIVSVGTTVDTYVVVFERVKDEIRAGRSVRVATERGYQSGIRTVLTANGAAFIGAFLLWWLTVGPVRGFAYFLGLSVILDLVVAILFARPLILLASRSERFARSRFFGVARTDQKGAVA